MDTLRISMVWELNHIAKGKSCPNPAQIFA